MCLIITPEAIEINMQVHYQWKASQDATWVQQVNTYAV